MMSCLGDSACFAQGLRSETSETSEVPSSEMGVDLRSPLFPDNLDEHPFPAAPVEFAVEDLLPEAEIQLAVRDGDPTSHPMTWLLRCASVPPTRRDLPRIVVVLVIAVG